MRKTIHAILFDFGGVLLECDPRRLYRRYFSRQLERELHLLGLLQETYP